jgi:PAS domain S-box-containing protein
MKHIDIPKKVNSNPAKLFLTLILLILLIDFGLEVVLYYFPLQNSVLAAVIECVLFTAMTAPALYFLLFQPMVKYTMAIKKVEDELIREKYFNENLIQTANVILVGLDTDGKINLFSKTAEKITGYSFDELKGKDWFETMVPKAKYPQVWEEFNRLKKNGELATNFENPILTKSGTEKIISWQNGKVFDGEKIIGTISFGIDITDKNRSDFEMKILSEIVQGVIHTKDLNDLLELIHKLLKKLLYAENCFFALYDKETGLFNFPYFVDKYDVAPEPQEMAKSCTQYVFRTGKSILLNPESFQKLKDQNEIELVGSASPSWVGVPLQTSSGVIGVMVLQHYEEENVFSEHHLKFLDSIGSQVANVIERKRTENELEKSFSLIAAALESTADGILVVSKNGKITNLNKKFLELWQIPEEIVATKNDEVLLSFVLDQLTYPEAFLNKIKELYDNDEEISSDIILFKDGRIFERYSQAQLFKGKSVGRVWSFRNITAQRKTLQALFESEARLSELNATKDKFFSIIAHDLKSPFNSILGFSGLLAEQTHNKDYDGVEEYANIVQESSQKAVDLLTNLIEWSRSQSGYLEFNPEYVEIGALINEVFLLSDVTARHKSILLTKEIPQHISLFIDKNMISSVLRNLISNAIKFTYPNGKIIIRAEQLEQEVKISIIDNGVGIDNQYLNRLFRIDESYSIPGTQNEKGTGLGLILCKEFIDKHKGKIWVESEPGKGSQFHFSIPKY